VHVTLRVEVGVPSLRQRAAFSRIVAAFRNGSHVPGFRLVHYSVQEDHLQLLVEAQSASVLSRAMQGLSVRLARGLNGLFARRGRFFADRYEARVLCTPREVRDALACVLNAARRHAARRKRTLPRGWLDPYSSAPWFDGWQGRRGRPPLTCGTAGVERAPLGRDDPRLARDACPETVPARSRLLRRAWRVAGLINPNEVPVAPRDR
jgi:hypothetical protein